MEISTMPFMLPFTLAGFLCPPLAFRALICRPVIWTNVDGQKQAGLSFPPSPFLSFSTFHTLHCQ